MCLFCRFLKKLLWLKLHSAADQRLSSAVGAAVVGTNVDDGFFGFASDQYKIDLMPILKAWMTLELHPVVSLHAWKTGRLGKVE